MEMHRLPSLSNNEIQLTLPTTACNGNFSLKEPHLKAKTKKIEEKPNLEL